MSSYINLHGNINLKVTDIQFDPQLNRPTKAIVGANGSHTSYQGMGGRLLTITCVGNANQITDLTNLYKMGHSTPLISKSAAKYNGIYHIVSFTHDEDKPNHFKVTMKLQEDYVFNMVRVNFVTYQVKAKFSGTEIKVGDKYTVSAT
jgi:phage protein U